MEVILGYPIWLVCAFVIGACVGSYLNVVIYRVPEPGLKVTEPKRSFCPKCKKDIPAYRNIPIFTWILQRGRCAECKAPIPFRYVFVEILTACLFLAAWWILVTERSEPAPAAALFVWILLSLLISISYIDADHMVIPVGFCYWGMGIGVVGAMLDPSLVTLLPGAVEPVWWEAGLRAALGLGIGWGGLCLVVILGKVFLGEKRMSFDEEREWYLREPETEQEELSFVIKSKDGKEDDEPFGWSDLFYRAKDRLELEGGSFRLDGHVLEGEQMEITQAHVRIGEKRYSIEEMESLSGKVTKVVIPREAMGSGDPPLMGLIGAFLGWQAVLLTLFTSCIYALLWALIGKIGWGEKVGFGRVLPFGPFLALGGVTWIFGGWQGWLWYFETLVRPGP